MPLNIMNKSLLIKINEEFMEKMAMYSAVATLIKLLIHHLFIWLNLVAPFDIIKGFFGKGRYIIIPTIDNK
jgi:hypothetical protein